MRPRLSGTPASQRRRAGLMIRGTEHPPSREPSSVDRSRNTQSVPDRPDTSCRKPGHLPDPPVQCPALADACALHSWQRRPESARNQERPNRKWQSVPNRHQGVLRSQRSAHAVQKVPPDCREFGRSFDRPAPPHRALPIRNRETPTSPPRVARTRYRAAEAEAGHLLASDGCWP